MAKARGIKILKFSELTSRVDLAIRIFYSLDSSLLDNDASEWTIAHRLAVYFETLFDGWNVDCEYNRVGESSDPKKNSAGKNVRPDINLHHRGMKTSADNLLVIEIKKQKTNEDFEKVKDYTRPPSNVRDFQYKYGLVLTFDGRLTLTWFENGEEKLTNSSTAGGT